MSDGPDIVPDVPVRLARTEEEREAVYRLRYEILVEEMHLFASVADHARRLLFDEHDDASALLIAHADGEPVGTVRLTFGADGPFPAEFLETYGMETFQDAVPLDAMAVFTRFVVRPSHRGTAVPFALVAHAARVADERQVELGFCDCQPHLINLYGRLGYRPYRQTYNDPQYGLMVPLVMFVDGDHLRAIGSPLLGTAIDPDRATSENVRRAEELVPPTPPVRSLEHIEAYDWSAEIGDGPADQALRLFAGLDETDLAAVLAHSHIIDIAPGDHLIRNGQVTRTMYVLLRGDLEYREGTTHLADAAIGEAVGDVAFLLRTQRTIDVVAGASGARVLSLNEPALRSVIESHSRAAALLLLNLSRMLAERVATRHSAGRPT